MNDHTDHSAVVSGKRVAYWAEGDGGTPLLLLHGFPQTRLAWRHVLPALAADRRVVVADLPGYGDSDRLGPGPAGFDKAVVAEHLVAFMRELGHDRFAVVGHDRGGLVAFRAALDHPEVITHVGVLDILPTADNWAALRGPAGVFAFHLYLLAQPDDFPERLLGRAPDVFFGHFLDGWTKVSGAIPPNVRAEYLRACGRPETIAAICDDYRASAFVDDERDRVDQERGARLAMPVLAAWQDPCDVRLPFDPAAIWRSWAGELTTEVMPCGHFIPEEQPERLIAAIRELLRG
ncbi:alpha/beta fold hydrolase [Labedaea rhizosphaerae]|uniref:Pimeloyl-ACP methyl ester carboxylesterase n=1 Tax=Labedaea rhizosphaerae TaxID=598644 RepID=A0A4R6SMS1_LABRH|nr:alpha/beta hydrolase [Labedaea rhizosphaerae]TDQ04463.1 pimeloyl-ACP methyl ester carboxylesterase [Labedaea rhizosphaerae]